MNALSKVLSKVLPESTSESSSYPMTIPQRILFSAQLVTIEPAAVREFNVISWIFSVSGDVDLNALEQTYNELVRQHDALRMHMKMTPLGHRQSVAPYEYSSLPRIELKSEDVLEAAASSYRKTMRIPTRSGKPVDAIIFYYPGGASLFIRCSHYCFDGESIALAANYLKEYYEAFSRGELPKEIDSRCSVAKFTANDNDYRRSDRHRNDLAFWKELHRAHPNYRHALRQRKLHGEVGSSSFTIGGEQYIRMRSLCKELMVPVSFFMESIGALTLYSMTDNADFCFAQIVQERVTYFERKTIGCMMFTFPVMYTIDLQQPAREFFRKSYLQYLDTFKHGMITPVERLFLSLRTTIRNRDFNFYSIMVSALDLPDIKDERYKYSVLPHGNLPHQMYCTLTDNHTDEARLLMDYQSRRFTGQQIESIWENYGRILDNVLNHSDSRIGDITEL